MFTETLGATSSPAPETLTCVSSWDSVLSSPGETLKNLDTKGLGNGSVNIAGCSSRRPGFSSQHLHAMSQYL